MILLPPRATRTYTLFPNTTLFLSLPYKILGSLLSLNGCCLMDDDRLAEFMQFSRKHRHKFKRIAKATRNECEHDDVKNEARSEEHTSELQSLMRNTSAVFCFTKNKNL